jgi:1-deoxy-D-xylulose-5-phosphate synthase
LFAKHSHVVTLEPNTLPGGFGAGLLELAAGQEAGRRPAILRLGYPDVFVTHGALGRLLEELELDEAGLMRRVRAFLT